MFPIKLQNDDKRTGPTGDRISTDGELSVVVNDVRNFDTN